MELYWRLLKHWWAWPLTLYRRQYERLVNHPQLYQLYHRPVIEDNFHPNDFPARNLRP